MKRIAAIIAFLLLLIPAVGWGQHWPFMGGESKPYSWLPPSYYFAWDISSGLAGYRSGGVPVTGVNTAGSLVAGQYWESNADNDELRWTFPDWGINTGAFTVYMEVYVVDVGIAVTTYFFQAEGDANDCYLIRINNSEKIISVWYGNNDGTNVTATDTGAVMTCQAWTTLGASINDDGAAVGNDHASDNHGGASWVEVDSNRPDWVGASLTSILIGSDNQASTAEVWRCRKLVILPGYKTAKPW